MRNEIQMVARLVARGAMPATVLVLVCVFYLVFVSVLFAGFTADIQREMISRQLSITTPGELERVVLQGRQEAEFREDVRRLRLRIRDLDAGGLDLAREELDLRQETMLAWRTVFDKYAAIGDRVNSQSDYFTEAFRNHYITALSDAYDFLAGEGETATEEEDAAGSLARAEGERRSEGEHVMAGLRDALDTLDFSPDADEEFRHSFAADIAAAANAVLRYGEVRSRVQVEWANLDARRDQRKHMRENLSAEMNELQKEAADLAESIGEEHWSLVALFQQPIGRVLSVLMQMPAIMLTLLVTLAAGGLGSVVAFIRGYHRKRPGRNLAGPLSGTGAGTGAGTGGGTGGGTGAGANMGAASAAAMGPASQFPAQTAAQPMPQPQPMPMPQSVPQSMPQSASPPPATYAVPPAAPADPAQTAMAAMAMAAPGGHPAPDAGVSAGPSPAVAAPDGMAGAYVAPGQSVPGQSGSNWAGEGSGAAASADAAARGAAAALGGAGTVMAGAMTEGMGVAGRRVEDGGDPMAGGAGEDESDILPPAGLLLVRVSEGIAAAIAIFLLAQAGMLMLAKGSEDSGKLDISPFLLTFMAFVSGFMAEDAFNRIQDAGRKLFRPPEDDRL